MIAKVEPFYIDDIEAIEISEQVKTEKSLLGLIHRQLWELLLVEDTRSFQEIFITNAVYNSELAEKFGEKDAKIIAEVISWQLLDAYFLYKTLFKDRDLTRVDANPESIFAIEYNGGRGNGHSGMLDDVIARYGQHWFVGQQLFNLIYFADRAVTAFSDETRAQFIEEHRKYTSARDAKLEEGRR